MAVRPRKAVEATGWHAGAGKDCSRSAAKQRAASSEQRAELVALVAKGLEMTIRDAIQIVVAAE